MKANGKSQVVACRTVVYEDIWEIPDYESRSVREHC